MTLTFTPARQVYDADGNAVRFLALDGQKLVVCAVDAAALMKVDQRAYVDARSLLEAFERHRPRLLEIANAKYERHRQNGVAIAIGPDDLAA